jgi:hypothetical protein
MRSSALPTVGGTNLRTVAITAYEIASAMSYIHQNKILHLVRNMLWDVVRAWHAATSIAQGFCTWQGYHVPWGAGCLC